jgi:hypothetical protein
MDCPECGAPEKACEQRYHECLVKEFTQADFGVVHHLTVSAYMLQHSSQLTTAGWRYERNLLRQFLVEGEDPTRLARQNRGKLDSGKRDFKITEKGGQPKVDPNSWRMTVLDVHLEDAKTYCQEITAWAQAVMEDAEHLQV